MNHKAKTPGWKVWLITGCLLLAGGCATTATPQLITQDQFESLYKDEQNITDVWYMGRDAQYDYFCMEQWAIKPDGSDGTLLHREFYKVTLADFQVKLPFAYTTDSTQWRLMRPKPS